MSGSHIPHNVIARSDGSRDVAMTLEITERIFDFIFAFAADLFVYLRINMY